jgi:hypothetical protein
MKTNLLLGLAVSMSLMGGQALPAAAQATPAPAPALPASIDPMTTPAPAQIATPAAAPTRPSPSLLLQSQAQPPAPVTIPATTGVIVSFLAPVTINADEAAYPLTVPLTQAINDAQGNVLIPENSPVSILIQPEDGGAKIVAQSIVINGQIVPIKATSPLIPGTTITHMRANERAAENGATFGRIAATGFGFLGGGNPEEFDRGAMLGTLFGMVTGRRDESTRVVQIPQGSVYVLAVEEAIQLSR